MVTIYRYDAPDGETFYDAWVDKGGPNEDPEIKKFKTTEKIKGVIK